MIMNPWTVAPFKAFWPIPKVSPGEMRRRLGAGGSCGVVDEKENFGILKTLILGDSIWYLIVYVCKFLIPHNSTVFYSGPKIF